MDEAKNMALLFFVDHLMQKGGQRTIHDLSCQFGARGFTDEMRQAVGTCQEGLCEFLGQYPSLFTIRDGDQVQLKGFGEGDEGRTHLSHIPPSGRQRDYVLEAVQFFVAKLEKFGPEMQVKSLLGHRSQAAPEVRLVSGRHLKEFADFLAAQTDHFTVESDRVRLKNMPEPQEADANQFVDEEGRPLVGHRAKLAAVDFMRGVLEQNEDVPIPLDAFYRRFCDRFPHNIRQEVATNPKELLLFLKLNRHVFFIRSNKVQLVRNRPGDEHGSESGRSTAEDGGSSDRSATSPAENDGFVPRASVEGVPASTLFPLNRDNVHRVQIAQTLKQAQEAVRCLHLDLDSALCPFLAVDFKLVSLGSVQPEQFVALVVVASPVRLVVFDLAHAESVLSESGLRTLLENDRLLKVLHDVQRIATLLASRWDIRIGRLFDTQIAHSVIQHDKFSKPLSDLRAISFVNLQRVYFPQSLVMSDVPARKLSQTLNWADRPMSTELLLAACEECHCLASGLFRLLDAQLPHALRPLFVKLCSEATVTTAVANGTAWNERNGRHRETAHATPPPERKVMPLLELPLNGLYRPPATRRRSSQNQPQLISRPFGQPPINGVCGGGFGSSPIRKDSAPPATPHRSATWPTPPRAETREACTQTLSTGEIAVLKVYYDEEGTASNNGTKREL
uniref:3'-5' exonuclease domain-containing protein n=1 Tax=Globodera pallida TaxID=36090 RepID=A0A183CAP9_GLOPA